MKFSRFIAIFFLPALFCGINACSREIPANSSAPASNAASNTNASVQIVPQDDAEELGRIVKLPIAPEEVTYIENVLDGKNAAPDKRKLVAVLKFSNQNAAELAAQAEKIKPGTPADVDAEMWFPPELIAKSQETGDEFLKGIAYAADSFLQPPYLNGRLTRVNNTDYFILELTSF